MHFVDFRCELKNPFLAKNHEVFKAFATLLSVARDPDGCTAIGHAKLEIRDGAGFVFPWRWTLCMSWGCHGAQGPIFFYGFYGDNNHDNNHEPW